MLDGVGLIIWQMRRGLVLKKSSFLVHLDEYLKKFWAVERCWLAELADVVGFSLGYSTGGFHLAKRTASCS